ncbi:unnamed protein product [Heterobilharzia americana]|nr:unnamed protein product [Heterobilharzia americana]
MNKFLSTSQIDWLHMDKNRVDPIISALNHSADGVSQEPTDFFADVCVDVHSEEQSATGSCVNPSEVDGVSFMDSEYNESWEAAVCSSEVSVVQPHTTRCSLNLAKDITESSKSMTNLPSDSDLSCTVKCWDLVSSQNCSSKETCDDIFTCDKRCVVTDNPKNCVPRDSVVIHPQVSPEMTVGHSPINPAIRFRLTETKSSNSFGLPHPSIPSYNSLSCGSDFPAVEADSFTSSSERSTIFASPASLQSLDFLKQRKILESEFQRLEEIKSMSPSSSPISRKPGPLKGSSPSAAHHCSLCGKQYRHVASLRNHMRKHTSGVLASKRYKCNHCVYSSQYHRNVIKHMEATHPSHEGNSPLDASHFCGQGGTPCSTIIPDDLKPNLISSRVWIPYTKVEQNVCDASSEAATPKEPAGFAPLEEKTSFSVPNSDSHFSTSQLISPSYNSGILDKHLERDYANRDLGSVLVSTDVTRSFRCDISGCERTFRSVRYLSNHMKDSHRDLKQFKCPLEGCSFGGLRRMHLKRHINEFHNDKKLSLYRMLDQNRLDSKPYSSIQHVAMYGGPERFSPNIIKIPGNQPSERQYCNPQMTNFMSKGTTYSNEYSYDNSECHGNDVYSFPVSSLSAHSSREVCGLEHTDRLLSDQVSEDVQENSHSVATGMPNETNRPFQTMTSDNTPAFQNEQSFTVSSFRVQSEHHSASNQSVHYHQRDPNKLSNATVNESLQEQLNSFPSNPPYSNVTSCMSFNHSEPFTNPNSTNDNRPSEPDIVEQLLDKPDVLATALDHILCEPIEACKDEEHNQDVTASELRVKTPVLSAASVNGSYLSPSCPEILLPSNTKSSMSDMNTSMNNLHSSNVISETDAFFSDLQEILARDMPMLTSSTPRGTDSSELVVTAVKDMIIESKSPTGITGCKLMGTSSLPSTDSGHECWSSSSSCSAGPNSTSVWGLHEAVTPMKVSSPLPSSNLSHQPSSTTNRSASGMFESQVVEQVSDEQLSDCNSHDQLFTNYSKTAYCISGTVDDMSVTPYLPFTAPQQPLSTQINKNVRLGNTSQSTYSRTAYDHGAGFAQNSQSPICNLRNPQFKFTHERCSSSHVIPAYRSCDSVMNQQNSAAYFTSKNSHMPNDFTQNREVFNCRQTDIRQINQYPSTSLSPYSEPACHSTFVQSKFQNHKVSEIDMRITSSLRNYPTQPQEHVYWQSNTKYHTGPYEPTPVTPTPCRNIVLGGCESLQYENSMSYSQYNFPTSTRVTDSTIPENDIKPTAVQNLEQLPIRNTGYPTKYVNFPDTDNNVYDRNSQENLQMVGKRWATADSQRFLNPCFSRPSLNYPTSNMHMSPSMYQPIQQSVHSLSRPRLELADSCISRMQSTGPYFSNQHPQVSQYYSNSVCYSQPRYPSQYFSPHSQYPPSQSICRDTSQTENYSVGDRRFFAPEFYSSIPGRYSNTELYGNWSSDKFSSHIGNEQGTVVRNAVNNSSLVEYSSAYSSNFNSRDQNPESYHQFLPNPQTVRFPSNSVEPVETPNNRTCGPCP